MRSISPLDWVIREGCASPNLGEGPHPSELSHLGVVCAEGGGRVLNRLDPGPLPRA